MAKTIRSDWASYWDKFSDLDLLQAKSFHLDETLREIEQQVGFKLLSGDQMQIIVALEDRIRELHKRSDGKKSQLQVSLFD